MYFCNVYTSFSSTQQSKFTNFSRHSEYVHSAATITGLPSIRLCPREFLTEQFHLTFLYVFFSELTSSSNVEHKSTNLCTKASDTFVLS